MNKNVSKLKDRANESMQLLMLKTSCQRPRSTAELVDLVSILEKQIDSREDLKSTAIQLSYILGWFLLKNTKLEIWCDFDSETILVEDSQFNGRLLNLRPKLEGLLLFGLLEEYISSEEWINGNAPSFDTTKKFHVLDNKREVFNKFLNGKLLWDNCQFHKKMWFDNIMKYNDPELDYLDLVVFDLSTIQIAKSIDSKKNKGEKKICEILIEKLTHDDNGYYLNSWSELVTLNLIFNFGFIPEDITTDDNGSLTSCRMRYGNAQFDVFDDVKSRILNRLKMNFFKPSDVYTLLTECYYEIVYRFDILEPFLVKQDYHNIVRAHYG